MPMYNLIEYSDNYSNITGSLWQYYWDELFLDTHGTIADFPADDNISASIKFKTKIEQKTMVQEKKMMEQKREQKQAEQKMMVQKMLKLWYH